jgi:hypothetical protein
VGHLTHTKETIRVVNLRRPHLRAMAVNSMYTVSAAITIASGINETLKFRVSGEHGNRNNLQGHLSNSYLSGKLIKNEKVFLVICKEINSTTETPSYVSVSS